MPVNYEIIEQDNGYQILGGAQFKQVVVPATTYLLNNHATQRFFHRQPYARPEISFDVPLIAPTNAYIEVLLLTPDMSAGGDLSLITTTLSAY